MPIINLLSPRRMAATRLLLLITVGCVCAWERLTIEKIEAEQNLNDKNHGCSCSSSFNDKISIEIDNHRSAWPNGLWQYITPGETVYPNIEHFFDKRTTVRLIYPEDTLRYQDVSNILGTIMIENESKNFTKRQVSLDDDRKIKFYLTYTVEHNVTDVSWMKSMLCGTTKCKYCDVNFGEYPCQNTNILGLDRDEDQSDIRNCPPGYVHVEFKKYPQINNQALYLRLCSPIEVTIMT